MKKICTLFVILSLCINVKSQIYINEVFASNASTNLNTVYYNFYGWAELYNGGTSSINVGNYYFSDNKNDKTMWRLPSISIGAKACYIFWFNEKNIGDNTNFKLDAKGDVLFLYNMDGSIIDSITYPKQYPNISFTRYPDGGEEWKYNSKPTISNLNSNSVFHTFTSSPEFSQSGGFFSSPINISISTLNPNTEIRYTVNGSEPNENSLLYSGSILVNKTTIIRARVYEPGNLPSEILSQSYIFADRELTLPVYSLMTDSMNLWDNTMGIYPVGTNGTWGYCANSPKNYNQDWERPLNIEYFDTAGIQQINQYAGFKIAGNCTRGFSQKPLALIPRNLYGKGKLKYKFFDNKNIAEFDRLFLRNSGNDWNVAFIRDALFNALIGGKIDIDFDAYKPSIVYLNGNYWGMLDTREKIDENYITSNYGLEKDQFDMLELNGSVINGRSDDYNEFINYITAYSISNSANYQHVKTLIDIDEYINYMIMEIYIANTDWPGNNIKFWKPKSTDGKWRWIVTDTDFGFGLYDRNVGHNTLQFALEANGSGWPNPPWSTFVFRKLTTNAEFNAEFTSRFADYLNTIFAPNAVIHALDSLTNIISDEIYYHNQKWNAIGNWEYELEYLRNYAKNRPSYIRQHLQTKFGLSATFKLTVSSNMLGGGNLFINQMPVNGDYFNGIYFNDYSVHLKPEAREGYKFIGWYKQDPNIISQELISKGSVWKYDDYGNLPSSDWYKYIYDDTNWKTGAAQLGYGDGDEATVLNYGGDGNNKYITSYFRKSFSLINATSYTMLNLSLLVDDGAIIYMNGNEVFRANMPLGLVNNSTLASGGVADESAYAEYNIPLGSLIEGTNTIAVEVHQSSPTSSDISFDLQLTASKNQPQNIEFVSGSEIDISSTKDIDLLAKYQYLGDIPEIYFNEFVATNSIGQADELGYPTPWIELFNNSTKTANIAGWHISNDKENLTLWQIPSSDLSKTIITPKGFKVLWADGQTAEGVLHLPFPLAENGGQLFLSHISGNDTTIVDSISYPKQASDAAYGRYKDGALTTFYLSSPSPSFSNRVANRIPEFTSTPVLNANENSLYTYNITAFDYDGDKLIFGDENLPSWLTLTDNNNGTATLQGTPQSANHGLNPVLITVSDGKPLSIKEHSFNIQVGDFTDIIGITEENWQVFPNPVKDNLNVFPAINNKSYHIRITDLLGKIIIEKNNISGKLMIDMKTYSKGVYYLNIECGVNSFVTKLIKAN